MIYDIILIGVIFAWSIQKIIDKELLKHSNSENFANWSILIMFVILLPFVGFVNLLSKKALAMIFFLAFLSFVNTIIVFHSIKRDEVSRVIPFEQFNSFFAVILAIFFLGETPSAINILGILIMALSGILISMEKPYKNLKQFTQDNYAIIIILGAAIIASVNTTISKEILFGASAFSLVFFRRLFATIFIIPRIKRPDIKNWPIFITSKILSTGGLIIFFYVLGKQELYLTTPILAIQPLFVLLLSHRLLDEKKFFKRRMISIIILIIGYILLKA